MNTALAEKSKRLDIPVSGMTCAACARAVQNSLSSTEGVEDARVNFATGTATVSYDEGRIDRAGIVKAIQDVGYDVKEDQGDEGMFQRFLVAVVCAAAVMFLSMLHRLTWLQFALAVPVMFYSAKPFFEDAWSALRHRQANMNTLIALGSGTAFVYSVGEVVRGRHDVYFEAACVIVALILLGRFLESGARRKTSESIRLLMDMRPQTARVERGEAEVEIPAEELRLGEVVVVRPGERVPCDGAVISGGSAVDESMLTGESMPVEKQASSPVFRGTMNQSGSMRVLAQKVGSDTALDRIIELVAQAQNSRAPIARLADTVSGYFTMVVLAIAALTAVVWLIFMPSLALTNAVAVLIVACPCALGLATPAAIVAGIGRGAQRGILIKNGEALEAAAGIDTVVFDKTGTLTVGEPMVERVSGAAGFSEDEVVRWAAAVEKDSEHPLGAAIRRRAGSLTLAEAQQFRALAGWGVSGLVDGHEVSVHRAGVGFTGGESFAGLTIAEVSVDQNAAGWIGIADRVRDEARETVSALGAQGYQVRMLTGDNRAAGKRIAAQVGIREFAAELRPEDKEQEIKRLRAAGRRVAMVGDGVNDAPALATADVGIALGSGSDVAAATGGITILGKDLRSVTEALVLARKSMRVIRQNLFWAFAYNLIALPIAAGVLYPVNGWVLSPMIASAPWRYRVCRLY